MSILVFGRSGQVARELIARLPGAVFLGREQVDLASPETAAAAIRAHRPQLVINAAAWTAVDRAEAEEAAAFLVNAAAPAAMAAETARLAIPFVHISTDYVFNGSGTKPWTPEDATGPINAYGRSKLAGEDAVRASGGAYAILRTSWVFSAHGSNFVKTMLRLSETRDRLDIVADQIGGPTPAADIAAACIRIGQGLTDDPGLTGTYHFSGAGDVSWADFAASIFTASGRPVAINKIPTSAYITPAKRPLNSRLDCDRLSRFGLAQPDWRSGLVRVLSDLGVSS